MDTQTAVAEQPVVEVTEDQELSAIFDKSQEEPVDVQPEAEPDKPVEVAEAPEVEEEAPQEVAKPEDEFWTSLPKEIRDNWSDIPETARSQIVKSHKEFSKELSRQGRIVQGIKPIHEAVVEAGKQFPALRDMRPEDVAKEVFNLARVSSDFAEKPVETLLGLAKKHGMEDQLRAALSGQAPTDQSRENTALKQHIAKLEQKISRFDDPSFFRDQVTAITSEEKVNEQVQKFAGTAEHWGSVEAVMPQFIEVAKAKAADGASATDILQSAYDMAVNAFVEPKASAQPSVEDMVVPDPERTAAAARAKSVNVTGKSTGKPKPLSEDDELAAVWDKAQKR